jgi:DNA topoisomerase-2
LSTEEKKENGEKEKSESFEYLLSMAIWSLTQERVEQIKEQLRNKEA